MPFIKKDLKYLLIGNKGQLGSEFEKNIIARGCNYFAADVDTLDITNYKALSETINFFKPDIIINCAAFNQVDLAEQNKEQALKVNATALNYLAELCQKNKAFLIHFSTDYVFNGNKNDGFYNEIDETDPINYYGYTKLEGERFIQQQLNNYLIFRLSWVFGNGKQNFIYKFLQWCKQNTILKISFDEVSVPTSTETIVNIVEQSIYNGLIGTYHLTNSGYASRYEWAKYITEILNLNVLLYPVSKDSFKLPAKRPYFSAMSNQLLTKTLAIDIINWKEAVKKFINK